MLYLIKRRRKMNFQVIEKCLEDYLQALYISGTDEEQNEVTFAISELQKIKEKVR
jgi:hypothetical protein